MLGFVPYHEGFLLLLRHVVKFVVGQEEQVFARRDLKKPSEGGRVVANSVKNT